MYNTRDINSQINSSNVSKLKVAWTIPLSGTEGIFGYYANTPIFSPDGKTVYLQDLQSNVSAVDAATGKIEWKHKFNSVAEGPNGLTLSDGTLYGETVQKAFAIDASTGKVKWLTKNLAKPIGSGSTFFKYGQGFNMAPAVAGGKVFTSTSAQLGGGIAYALDASDGHVLWSFNEVKQPADRKPSVVPGGSAGAWNAPLAVDGQVYFGIANPYLSIDQALKHPRKLLYDNSTVDVNPNTGKIKWYYQNVPDDFYDSDMQISPIYAADGPNDHPEVLDASKAGFVYAFDPDTGKLLWKTSVGKHNGHDDDGQLAMEHKLKLKLPYKRWPGTQGGVETNMAYADGTVYVPDNDLYQIRNDRSAIIGKTQPYPQGTGEMVAIDTATGKIKWDTKLPSSPYGDATVTGDLVFTTLLNGKIVAFDRSTGKIVWQAQLPSNGIAAPAIDGNTLVAGAGYPEGKGQKPAIVAYSLNGKGASPASTTSGSSKSSSTPVSLAAGKNVFDSTCASCHTLAAAGSTGTVGPNLDQLKPSDALVVKQVTNGGGGMPAFGSTLSKGQIQSVAKYVSSVAGSK